MSETRRDVPPDLAPFFEAEASRSPLPAARRDAVFARLSRSLALPAAFDDPSRAPPGTNGAAVPQAAGDALLGAAAKPLIIAALAFAVGAASGAGVYAARGPSAPPTLATGSVPRVVVVTVRTASPAVTPPPIEEAAASAVPSAQPVPDPARAAAPPLGAQESLAEERALLEAARAAVKARDSAGAVKRLQRHAARFPNGQLAEEREALWVQALFVSGSAAEGGARAERFRTRFPESVFAPAIDASRRASE